MKPVYSISIFLNFQAVETFKECGKKDSKMAGTAATNLSFIYFLVSQSQQLYVILSLLLQILFLHIFMRLSLAHCYPVLSPTYPGSEPHPHTVILY